MLQKILHRLRWIAAIGVIVATAAVMAWFGAIAPQEPPPTAGLGVSRAALLGAFGAGGMGYELTQAFPTNGEDHWNGEKTNGTVDIIGPTDDVIKVALAFRISQNSVADNTAHLDDMARTIRLITPKWNTAENGTPEHWLSKALETSPRSGEGLVTAVGNTRVEALVLGGTMFLSFMPMRLE